MALGKTFEADNIMNVNEAELLINRRRQAFEEHTETKFEELKNSKSLYIPKGDFELHKKSNEFIKEKYKGVYINVGDENFTDKMIPTVAKHVKDDSLWSVINQHHF